MRVFVRESAAFGAMGLFTGMVALWASVLPRLF